MESSPQVQHRLMRRIFNLMSGLGFIIMLLGLGLDLLPGSSPGISFPQLMLILAGIVLLSFGLLFRKDKRRRQLTRNIFNNLLISLLVVIVMIVILEGILALTSKPVRYPAEILQLTLEPADYWTCDELGCRYNIEAVQVACANGSMSNRHCIINDAGFHDSQQFIDDHTLEQASLRAFVLGDSFTFGASAKLGHSWVETIESSLPDAVIWNTGMPGTGSNQALEVLKQYASIMKPDIIILGFYLNDFEDNIYPLDQFFRGNTSDGDVAIIQQYQSNDDGTFTKISDPTHLLYRLKGVEPPNNQIEQWLGGTRLGSLILGTVDSLHRMLNKLEGITFDQQVGVTRTYLQEIQAVSETLNSQFLILLIPDMDDLAQPSIRYQTAIQLFDDLLIPYINPIEQLDAIEDYQRPPNVHWSTKGHETVGAIMAQCLRQFQNNNMVLSCDHLSLP